MSHLGQSPWCVGRRW